VGARYYDPRLGTFIEADPLTPGLGARYLNRYAYALNNPLTYVDPSGYAATAAAKENPSKRRGEVIFQKGETIIVPKARRPSGQGAETITFSDEEAGVIAPSAEFGSLAKDKAELEKLSPKIEAAEREAGSKMSSAAPYVGKLLGFGHDLYTGDIGSAVGNLGELGAERGAEMILEKDVAPWLAKRNWIFSGPGGFLPIGSGGHNVFNLWAAILVAPYDAWHLHEAMMHLGELLREKSELETRIYYRKRLLGDPDNWLPLGNGFFYGPDGGLYRDRGGVLTRPQRVQDVWNR
jgi:hypothetical protein